MKETGVSAPPCLVCGRHVHTPLLAAGRMPLSTQSWPKSRAAAQALALLQHRFVRCVVCGHVWNTAFDGGAVSGPVHMFNEGVGWRAFIARQVDRLVSCLPSAPRILEVGHGDGALLGQLKAAIPDAVLLGVDPCPSPGLTVPTLKRRFLPDEDLGGWRPDLLVLRHVIEHLAQPMAMLEAIVHAATVHEHAFWMYIEVPCFDVGLSGARASDLIYEHCSHFTRASFACLLQRLDVHIESSELDYADEVIWALVRVSPQQRRRQRLQETAQFRHRVARQDSHLGESLEELARVRTAIWGGTGKAALFIHRHGLDAERFPVVVDSDERKVGSHVPGTGQRIEAPQVLLDSPPDAILIATPWRAADIVAELRSLGLHASRCLVLHEGRLCDWESLVRPPREDSGA